MLSRFEGYVVRSVKLPIHHALLAKNGTSFSDINEICSHRQAIGQCSKFWAKIKKLKLPSAKIPPRLQEWSRKAKDAILPLYVPKPVRKNTVSQFLKKDLQNSSVNYTMFYCISKEPEIYPEITKSAFMFNIKNQAGSLENVLSRFSAAGINLTKIESRPIPGKDFEFMFYAEADISGLDEKNCLLFSQLKKELDFFKFIGAYREITVD